MFVQREAKVSRVFPLQCPPLARAVRDPLGPLPFPLSSFLFIPRAGQGLGRCFPPCELPNAGLGEPLEREALGFALGRWDELWAHPVFPELPEAGTGLDPQHIWLAACGVISQRP